MPQDIAPSFLRVAVALSSLIPGPDDRVEQVYDGRQ